MVETVSLHLLIVFVYSIQVSTFKNFIQTEKQESILHLCSCFFINYVLRFAVRYINFIICHSKNSVVFIYKKNVLLECFHDVLRTMKRIPKLQWWSTPLIPELGSRGREISLNSRTAYTGKTALRNAVQERKPPQSAALPVTLYGIAVTVSCPLCGCSTPQALSQGSTGGLRHSFSSSALFFSPSSSNGNSSSWSSLGLEGDLYEDNLSFPTSDRLVQFRNLKTDESFTTNA